MTAFTNDSIDELDRLARDTGDVFHMTRGGYVLATRREDISGLVASLHEDAAVDVVTGPAIATSLPFLAPDIRHVLHVRRAGSIDGQQLGAWMLGAVRAAGGRRVTDEVRAIAHDRRFVLALASGGQVTAEAIVNAAGPFAARVAGMLGEPLPVRNVFQQKLAFEDREGRVPRNMPFAIDLDAKELDWTGEERALLANEPGRQWLAGTVPAGTHCRPDGGLNGTWVKLGWAYNHEASEPAWDLANEPRFDPQFPEIVIRAAAALVPALRTYVDEPPRRYSHYGGYYTMTEENWPLIGPMQTAGAFMVAALSGFGSMAACAAGKLCAAWVCGGAMPSYATSLSAARRNDADLMATIRGAADKGIV